MKNRVGTRPNALIWMFKLEVVVMLLTVGCAPYGAQRTVNGTNGIIVHHFTNAPNRVCSVLYEKSQSHSRFKVPDDWSKYWGVHTFSDAVRQEIQSAIPPSLRGPLDKAHWLICLIDDDDPNKAKTHFIGNTTTKYGFGAGSWTLHHKVLEDFEVNGRQIVWCVFEFDIESENGEKTKLHIPYELRLDHMPERLEEAPRAIPFKGEVEWGPVSRLSE